MFLLDFLCANSAGNPELNLSETKPPAPAVGAPQCLRLISLRCNTEHLNSSFVLTAVKLFNASPEVTEAKRLLCLCEQYCIVIWTKSHFYLDSVNASLKFVLNYDLMMIL